MNHEIPFPVSFAASVRNVPRVVEPLVEAMGDETQLKDAILAAVQRMGFASFGFDRFNVSPSGLGPRWSNWGTTSEGFRRCIRARGYVATTPLHRSALRSSVPVVWNRDRYRDDADVAGFFEDAATFGICSGICMVISSSELGHVNFITVSSPERRVGSLQASSSVADLWALGAYGHRFLPTRALGGVVARSGMGGLTPRVLECLSMVAHGATSRAIAGELGISERTVNAHLEKAVAGLGARNRQHAVAKALAEGIIVY